MLWPLWWVLVIASTGANLVTRPWPDLSRLSRPPRHVRINPELPELEHGWGGGDGGKHSFIYKWVSRQIDNGPGNSGNFCSSEQIVNGCPDLRYENIALWHHQWPCPWLWDWGPPIHNIPYPDTMEETPLATTLSEAQLGSQLLWRQLIGDF